MILLDRSVEQIALTLGCTAGEVTDLMKHAYYRQLESEYMKELYGPIDGVIKERSAQRILEDASPDAAEALVNLLYDVDPAERRRAAAAVLDRSGHGPIQRRAVKHRHELDPVTAGLLGQAFREARLEEVESHPVRDEESTEHAALPSAQES